MTICKFKVLKRTFELCLTTLLNISSTLCFLFFLFFLKLFFCGQPRSYSSFSSSSFFLLTLSSDFFLFSSVFCFWNKNEKMKIKQNRVFGGKKRSKEAKCTVMFSSVSIILFFFFLSTKQINMDVCTIRIDMLSISETNLAFLLASAGYFLEHSSSTQENFCLIYKLLLYQ